MSHHFGVGVDEAELVRMKKVMTADAKSPSRPFEPDGESKRSAAPESLSQLCSSIVDPHYRELEATQRYFSGREAAAGSISR